MLAARLPFVAIGLVGAVLGGYLAVSSRGEARLDRANADLLVGRNAQALAELDGLGGEIGRRASSVRGHAYFNLGRLRQARSAFQTATRRDPNNWITQRDYAVALLALGERSKARARMRRARALNPRMPLPPGFVATR